MKKEKHVVISKGNIKLGNISSVSLPPIISCAPNACKFCGVKCYAIKMCKLRPTVKESSDNNLDILLTENEKYWREVNAAVAVCAYFRFHVAGDIYDADYLENMVKVARANKHCTILCFTKKYYLVNSYLKCHRLPKNLKIIFSVWKGFACNNKFNLPEAHIIYKDGTTTASDGAKYCSGNCTDCCVNNKGCWVMKKGDQIIFKEH